MLLRIMSSHLERREGDSLLLARFADGIIVDVENTPTNIGRVKGRFNVKDARL